MSESFEPKGQPKPLNVSGASESPGKQLGSFSGSLSAKKNSSVEGTGAGGSGIDNTSPGK
jgi:hypothetical protein